MTFISKGILAIELVLIENQVFHFRVGILVKMYQFLEQAWVLLHTLRIRKDLLVLGKGPTQGLEHALIAEKNVFHQFYSDKKKICLSLHHNGADSYLFINRKEIVKFKAKDSAIVATPLCLGKISKDWSANNIKKLG